MSDSSMEQFEISADPSKYVTLPIQIDEIWRMYQTTLDLFWSAHDVYIAFDKNSMEKAFKPEEQEYIQRLLSILFASHYCVINKELFMSFMSQVEIKEASYFFGSQADTKKTHSKMFSLLLDELNGNDTARKNKLLSLVMSNTSVRHLIAEAIQATTNDDKSFAQRLFAFATLQGVVFPAFLIIFKWLLLRNPSTMPGLALSNENIWRDEKLHFTFAITLFSYIDDQICENDAIDIIKTFVDATKSILTKAYPTTTVGLETELIAQYIESQADKLLLDLKFSKLYNKECPFDWAEELRIENNNPLDSSCDFGEAKFDMSIKF